MRKGGVSGDKNGNSIKVQSTQCTCSQAPVDVHEKVTISSVFSFCEVIEWPMAMAHLECAIKQWAGLRKGGKQTIFS